MNPALTSKGLAALYANSRTTGSLIPPTPGEVLDAVRTVDGSAKQLDSEIQTKKDKLDATFLAAWAAWSNQWTAYQKSHNTTLSVIPTGPTLREIEGWRSQLAALYATYEQRLAANGEKPATPPPAAVPFVAPPAPPNAPPGDKKEKSKLFGIFELPDFEVPWWVIAGATVGVIGGGALLVWWLIQQQKAAREVRGIAREWIPQFVNARGGGGASARHVEYVEAEPVHTPKLLTSGDPSPPKRWQDELPSQRYHEQIIKSTPSIFEGEDDNEEAPARRTRRRKF